MLVCKYDSSYYHWSWYCNLPIVMIRKYLKSDKYWSIVWIFAMAANFSYFVQYKNRYVYVILRLSQTLDLFCFLLHWHYAWCSIRYIHFKSLFRSINWVTEILSIAQYFNFILVDNEVSHIVEIISRIRYLNFFTV